MSDTVRQEFEGPPIPRGSVVNGAVVMVSYFDPEGELSYTSEIHGEMSLLQIIGLVEASKRQMFLHYERGSSE